MASHHHDHGADQRQPSAGASHDCCAGKAKTAEPSCHSDVAVQACVPVADCCAAPAAQHDSCCDADTTTRRIDWLLWGTMLPIIALYLFHVAVPDMTLPVVGVMSHAVYALVNTMWWGMVMAIVFVGLLSRIPRELVMGVLGEGGTFSGLLRATGAGLLLDLCSHGILMVGMKLYERGASLGQIFAFLIASPWNSLSLTIILVALIGLPWTLLFILLSMAIGIGAGFLVDRAVAAGRLPANPHRMINADIAVNWRQQLGDIYRNEDWSPRGIGSLLWQGLKDSRMVLRWVFLGVVLAALIRTFVTDDWLQMLFGPTLLGLGLTLVAATILEICSEGSTPIAAELFTRAHAPGNAFSFLMAGVATDYTEVMSIKDTTRSWKIALSLPLYTLPQVIFIGWLLNQFG